MFGPRTRRASRQGEFLRWLLALTPVVPLLATLYVGSEDHAKTLVLQVLFTIAAGCHLLLAFELVSKLRGLGAGETVPQVGVAALRVAVSFSLFWIAFAIALGLPERAQGAGFPMIYVIYCVAMLALLLAAFTGAFFLGRVARTRAATQAPARPQRRPS